MSRSDEGTTTLLTEEKNPPHNRETSPIPQEGEFHSLRPLVQKLIIQNFLSFEYDEVEFDPNFSIIIGPNGAGKSTIYQALKFVLGSNDYDGRYSKWADFIHTGAEEATVQVHIKVDAEEYIIQRTVQSKSTPKFLFKSPRDKKLTPASVKKIKIFTEKMQIDPNNLFSFMSQGNIDSLKDYKEQTICEFVEKGIGLDQTRSEIIQLHLKIQALRKEEDALLSQKEHLLHQLTELEPKIQMLKEKKKLEALMEDAKIELLIAEQSQIKEKIGQIEGECNQLIEEIQRLSYNVQELDKEIEKAEADKQEKENAHQNLYGERTRIKTTLDATNERIKDWTDEKNQIADNIRNLESKIKDLSQEQKQKIPEISLNESKLKKIEEKSTQLTEEIQALHSEERELRLKVQKHQESLIRYDAETQVLLSLQEQLQDYQTEHDQIELEISNRMVEIKKINNKLQKYQWFLSNPTENLPELMKREQSSINSQMETISSDLHALQTQYDDIVRTMENIKNSVLDKSFPKPKSIQGIMDEVKDRKLNCVGPLVDYITYDDIYRLAVESIFGYRVLFSFIARDSDSFLLLKNLAQKHGAKCNIYKERNTSLTSLPTMQTEGNSGIFGYLATKIHPIIPDEGIRKVIHTVAGRTLVVKDHLTGEKYIEQYNYTNWIVTLDGDQIRPKKHVMEARPRIKKPNDFSFYSVAQAKQKMNELHARSDINRSNYNKKLQDYKELERKLTILSDRVQQVDQLLTQYKLMEIKNVYKSSAIEKRKVLFSKIETKQQEITLKKQSISQIKNLLPESLVSQQSQLNAIPDQIAELNENLAEFHDTEKNLHKTLEKLKLVEAQLGNDISNLELKKAELQSNLQQRDVEFYQLFQNSMQMTKKLRELDELLKTHKMDLSDLVETLKNVHLQRDNLNMAIIQKESLKGTFEQKIQEATEQLQKIAEVTKGFPPDKKIRPISEIEGNIYQLENQIRQIRVDESILLEKEKIETIIDKIGEQRQTIKQEIGAAFSAQNQLEQSFYSTFNQKISFLQESINEKLQFAGQNFKVKLALTGEIDALCLSIITSTSIQGKEVRYPLAAVSGGQRSMVGICLMLSLNYLNPSALNIYDECDMFLDERNAQTVANLIHKLASTGIQFIILMPSKNVTLLKSANKVIGVSRNGKFGPSFVHYSRVF